MENVKYHLLKAAIAPRSYGREPSQVQYAKRHSFEWALNYSVRKIIGREEEFTERFIVTICADKTKDEPLAERRMWRSASSRLVRGVHGHSSLSEWI